MSRLTRKPSAFQILCLNAEQAQTEQQALHAEVNDIKDRLKCNHTEYTMLRADLEQFKAIVRAHNAALNRLHEEVMNMKTVLTLLTRPAGAVMYFDADNRDRANTKEQMRR